MNSKSFKVVETGRISQDHIDPETGDLKKYILKSLKVTCICGETTILKNEIPENRKWRYQPVGRVGIFSPAGWMCGKDNHFSKSEE